ncbi:MAG TPA: protease inhibitor I42 family protein [Methanocorpusculum sp.]|nr:protease inhibitor I42 family protein [Methanocorpusculum sp.]HJJ53213.1 protease inhibitor I42 family protein [Methanocorpusculum sp.]
MNKSILISIGACVLLACLFAAGCITPNVTANTADPVLTVTVVKEGFELPTGASMQYVLPSNPTTGYGWTVVKSTGLIVTEQYVATPVSEGMTGSGGTHYYTVTADRAGIYTFTAEYKRAWETNVDPAHTFTQTLVFSKAENNDRDNDVMLSVLFDGMVNPEAGDVVKISTYGIPTVGYHWTMVPGSKLTVLKDNFIPCTTKGLVGAGGTYEWYVTAQKAGTYKFSAILHRSNEDPSRMFFFDLTFV